MIKLRKLLTACLMLGILSFNSSSQAGLGDPFVGEVMWVPYNFAPRGWAFCDGQILPIAQNTALFSLIGTIYGGDGRTTFALPDVRSRVVLHEGQGPGLSQRFLGQKSGTENQALTTAQLASHSHTLKASGGSASQTQPANNVLASPSRTRLYDATANVNMSPSAIATSGGGQGHNNMSPYIVLNCVIALQGTFPSRN